MVITKDAIDILIEEMKRSAEKGGKFSSVRGLLPQLKPLQNEIFGHLDETFYIQDRDNQSLVVRGWLFHAKSEITELRLSVDKSRWIVADRSSRFDVHGIVPNLKFALVSGFRAKIPIPEDGNPNGLKLFFKAIEKGKKIRAGSLGTISIKTLDQKNVSALAPPKSDLEKAFESRLRVAKESFDNFLASSHRLNFSTYNAPVLSVIIAAYNKAELTFACLRSLLEINQIPIEIVIIDNASTDQTPQLFERLDGVQLVRNLQNEQFIKASNQGAERARGKYLLFLNSDCEVMPGSIENAFEIVSSNSKVGAVGARLVFPDGTLQEAGSVIWSNGRTLGYGRGRDPNLPEFMFQREVPYCSGAFLLTPKRLFMELGKFSESYLPAYYEDVDYCLKIQKKGLKIIYDPRTLVLHYESASSKNKSDAQELMDKNNLIFQTHYKSILKSYPSTSPDNMLSARSHPISVNKESIRILFIDYQIPHLSDGSGYPRANSILRELARTTSQVTLYPLHNTIEDWNRVYSDIPRNVEVMLGYGRKGLRDFLLSRLGYFDFVWVSRPETIQIFREETDSIREKIKSSQIIFDSEAVITSRFISQSKVMAFDMSDKLKNDLLRQEMSLYEAADKIVVVSEADADKFERYCSKPVSTIGHQHEIKKFLNGFRNRSGFLFVGPVADDFTPNADSLLWFLKEIWPKIRSILGNETELTCIGTNRSRKILAYENEQVKFLGRVERIDDFYEMNKIFIAPTRFAAGIPHKVTEAGANGIPQVMTSVLANQLGWKHRREALIADDPNEFAHHCIELYQNSKLWNVIRQNAAISIKKAYSTKKFRNKLDELLFEA